MPKKHKTGAVDPYETLLQESPGAEAMVRLFHGLPGILFCIKDRRGRYLCANDAFLRRARIAALRNLLGKTAKEIFPELLAAGYEQQDSAIFREGGEIRDRLEMITDPDGSFGWYLTDKVPIRNSRGALSAIACMSRDLHIPADNDPRIAQLAESIARMRRGYREPLRIARLAEESGMSISKFERLMRSILHVSPRQLLTRLRVEGAAERLKNTDQSLCEIALECGFCDQPTFCRQFKATTGMTASRYRARCRD